MKKLSLFALPLMLVLSGCLSTDQRIGAGPTISNVPTKDDLNSTADGLRRDVTNKQDAIQTNLSALIGASIGKLSDELIHFSADIKDLLHVQMGDIKNQMTASLASNNEIRMMLKAQMDLNASLQAQLAVQIKANADLNAMIDGKIQGIAGIAGQINQTTSDMKQNLQAGRDVNNITQQFTKEVLASIVSANRANEWNTTVSLLTVVGVLLGLAGIACFAICKIFANAKNHALNMVAEKDKMLIAKQAVLERALAVLPPHEVERIFPKSPDEMTIK